MENSPGRAIAPRRSCHSAVDLMLPSWMTLEMIVPENTPFGKVTCGDSSVRPHPQAHRYDERHGTHKVIKEPCTTCSDEGPPITLDGEPVGHTACTTCSAPTQLASNLGH